MPRQYLTQFPGMKEGNFEPFISNKQIRTWVKNAFHVKHNVNKDNAFVMPAG